jgi:hypothetical protein
MDAVKISNPKNSYCKKQNVNHIEKKSNEEVSITLNNNANLVIQPINLNIENKKKENCILITNSGESRVFTKKMLLEVINDIYQSKHFFDIKCFENKMPKETLEQHLYSYLHNKYGLKVSIFFTLKKNLIVEWANIIINGIKLFSGEDSEVFLFGKILKNEIEENYKEIIDKLKNAVNTNLEVKKNFNF